MVFRALPEPNNPRDPGRGSAQEKAQGDQAAHGSNRPLTADDRSPSVLPQAHLDFSLGNHQHELEWGTLVPAPHQEKSVEAWAWANGINPSYDLPRGQEDLGKAAGNDTELQLLLFPTEMERKLRSIQEGAQLALSEMGINILFVAFGFLEWLESGASERRHFAPLLLHPIKMERRLIRQTYRYSIQSTGEDTLANETLSERLRQDFGLELPTFDEADTPETYFEKVAEAIRDLKGWKIRRFVAVGLFPFARMAMYHDLAPDRWPAEKALNRHPILLALLTGGDEPESLIAEDYNTDLPEIASKVPILITDADSSQFSAIADVMSGRNVVIIGPPGTGKSQTITNIIAAALYEGKKVLFVAEKLAALEVVKKRLDEAGLGDFCLELHSTTVGRQAVYKSLKRRLEAVRRASGKPAEGLRQRVRDIIGALNMYAQELNTPFGSMGMTAQEVMWAYIRSRHDADRLGFPSELSTLRLDYACTLSAAGFNERWAALQSIEKLASEIEQQFGSVSSHPWFGTHVSPLTPIERDDLFGKLEAWLNAVEKVRCSAEETANLGIAISTFGDALSVAGVVQWLPATDPEGVLRVVQVLDHAETREGVAHLVKHLEAYHHSLAKISALGVAKPDIGEDTVVELLSMWETVLAKAGQQFATLDRLSGLFKLLEDTLTQLDLVHRRAEQLISKSGASITRTPNNLLLLGKALALVRDTPDHVLALRTPGLVHENTQYTLQRAAAWAADLRARRDSLGGVFVLRDTDDVAALRNAAGVIRSTTLIGRLFSRDYKAAERLWRSRRRTPISLSPAQKASELDELARYYEDKRRLEQDPLLHELCGSSFRGIDTDFAKFLAVTAFADAVRQLTSAHGLPGKVLRRLLLEGDADLLAELAAEEAEEPSFTTACSQLIRALRQLPIAIDGGPDQDLDVLREALSNLQDLLAAIQAVATRLGLRGSFSKADLEHLLVLVREREAVARTVRNNHLVAQRLQDFYQAEHTNVRTLREALAISERLYAEYSPTVATSVLKAVQRYGLEAVKQAGRSLAKALEMERRARRACLDRLVKLEWDEFINEKEPNRVPIGRLYQRLERLLEHRRELPGWIDFCRAWREAERLRVDVIVDLFKRKGVPFKHLTTALEVVVYQSQVEVLFATNERIKWLSGNKQESLRETFRQLDKELLQVQRAELAERLFAAPVPWGVGTGPKKTWTDGALLNNELAKDGRQLPVRELIQRAYRAIQALKPCWMMSPASIAQYVPPGTAEFDLVVIDEASQVRPEEALGAIARGRQLVVVGDPQQLPPTDFFRRLDDHDEESDDPDEDHVDSESILDLALRTFHPVRRLRWHYRSRHEDLIAFSNKEFYDSSLIIFPSARSKDAKLGVHYVFVNGFYMPRQRVNPVEAQRIADAAIEFMIKHPDRSLGIVCINRAQTELVQEEIYRRLAATPKAEEYRLRWEDTLEPFFIKNLENVQGDQRDVIFISTVYGPDPETRRVAQRFGPINSPHGHRRLNVLFTRAKELVVVFSSLKPEDIIADERSHRGVHVLRAYLAFARSGLPPATGKSTSREPDSDFEIFVAERLRTHGYQVVPQVGVNGYFVDIGVLDPDDPSRFLAGIECDGAMYHSAKSARDRDRLRQEQLEAQGWNIYRIWSVDWFSDPDREIHKLLTYLSTLRMRTRPLTRPLQESS